MRRIHALQFPLDPQGGRTINVWPEFPTGLSRPVDRNLDWLDVKAGDQMFVGGKRHTVAAVRVYRADGLADPVVVTCGRDWLRSRAG